MKTMAFEIGRDLIVGVYSGDSPSDDEWNAYVDALRPHAASAMPVLTVSDGGGPNAGQRQRLLANYTREQNKRLHVAVVSDAMSIYGVVTAISWFNSNVKAFKVASIDDALAHLELKRERFPVVKMRVAALRRELGLPKLKI